MSCGTTLADWRRFSAFLKLTFPAREIQKKTFRKQIRIARELNLPIIIHSRDANSETVEILTEECANKNFRGGIMHCFGGTPEMAETLMDIGFLISFAGNVSFKKGGKSTPVC